MGYGLLEASGTYAAKINPSTDAANACWCNFAIFRCTLVRRIIIVNEKPPSGSVDKVCIVMYCIVFYCIVLLID